MGERMVTGMVVTEMRFDEDEVNAEWERRLVGIEYDERLKLGRSHVRGALAPEDKVHRHNIRATWRGATGTLTTAQWFKLRAMFDGVCAYCGKSREIHLEHVVPVSRGGDTSQWNVVPGCLVCNLRKGTKDPADWLSETGRLDAFVERCLSLSGIEVAQ